VLLALTAATSTSGAARETKQPFRWRSPTWSPDSAVLAFGGGAERSRGLFRASPDGGKLRPIVLASNPSSSPEPETVAWSPRGSTIVWTQRWGTAIPKIFVSDARRRGKREIARGESPAWGPSGRLIAYAGRTGIQIIRPTGRGGRRLTSGCCDSWPTWSPDGKYIAFTRRDPHVGIYDGGLYVVSSSGRGLRKLVDRGGGFPAWSPDGRQVAFLSAVLNADGSNGPAIYVVDRDGTNERRLTTSYTAQDPSWSPDSSMIAFDRTVTSQSERDIAVIARDGSGGEGHVAKVGYSTGPVWSPDGRKIAFVGEPPRCLRYGIYVVSARGGRPHLVTPCRYGN